MIRNPSRLYLGVAQAMPALYKLRLLEHFLLRPLGEHFDFEITSAYRTHVQQNIIANDPKTKSLAAKGTSQHEIGEAVDIIADDPIGAFEFIHDKLEAWQLILYFTDDKPTHIHLSMPSEILTIHSRVLLHVDGSWQFYRGTYPTRA